MSTNKTVGFYQELCKLITGAMFNQVQADWLAGEVESIDPPLSCGDYVTFDHLRDVYNEFQDADTDLDLMEQLSEWAFTDLAPLMSERSALGREAWRAFINIASLSDTHTKEDLYTHILECDPLKYNSDAGFSLAKVTVLVSSLDALKDLFKDPKNSVVEMGHFSESRKELSESLG